MNVTAWSIKRLRHLVNLLPKEAEATILKNKEIGNEQDDIDNNCDNVNHCAPSKCASDEISRLLPVVNGTKHEVESHCTSETKDEGEMKMDLETFHQILREVIKKRTLIMETRLMGDIERLKKQISELESQKKKLQFDSERLKQTLNEITLKQQRKPEMSSCATQVDIELLQERPMSPEISKPIMPTSRPVQSNSFIENKRRESSSDLQRVEGLEPEQIFADTTQINLESSKAVNTGTFKTILSSNRHEISTGQVGPMVGPAMDNANTPKTSNEVVVDMSTCSFLHGQRKAAETSMIQDHHVGQQKAPAQILQNPCIHLRSPNPLDVCVEVPHARQEPVKIYNTENRRPANTLISGQHHSSQKPTESTRQQLQMQQMPAQQKHSPHIVQLLKTRGPDAVVSQSHPLANQGTVNQTDHRSTAAFSRLPPNVSQSRPPKRKRIENPQASEGLQMHVVASNSSYVMHNFKVQKSPSYLKERSRRKERVPGSMSTNQIAYTNSPSNPANRLPETTLTATPAQNKHSIYPGVYRASNPTHSGLSQGQLLERTFYPQEGSQLNRREQQSRPRLMPGNGHHRMSTSGDDRPLASDVYAVQGYQASGNRALLTKPNAPASSAAQKNSVYPPVQSPGISSTASLSKHFPRNPKTTFVPCSPAMQPNTSAARIEHPQPLVKTLPKPIVSIVVVQEGIVLSWDLEYGDSAGEIDNYELFACQDGAESTNPPITWKKIGIVKALPLPMACTLTQFSAGNKYHFAVRAVDEHECAGPFSDPCTISLTT